LTVGITAFVEIGGEVVRVYLFVATLGYARRGFVAAFRHERQTAWFEGLERAFHHFGGVPAEVLFDNAKPLVVRHDPVTREVVFNDRLHAFARYWDFRRGPVRRTGRGPRVRTRTASGTSRRMRLPAIALPVGRRWRRTSPGGCARSRMFVCTARRASRRSSASGVRRRLRFARSRAVLPSGRFVRWCAVSRRMARSISTPTYYSVPWRLIGAQVRVEVAEGLVRIFHAGVVVAGHDERRGRRERVIDAAHLVGIIAHDCAAMGLPDAERPAPAGELLRPLSEYERVAGGAW
jgi:hypothetical protein